MEYTLLLNYTIKHITVIHIHRKKMRKIITRIYQYYFEDMKLKISSNSSLMNPFTINCLHLANCCRHLISDCLSILSCSGFTCSKQRC